jgi:hypothetical protein
MTALDVLAAIRRSGGDVKVVGPDRLKVIAPPALLPGMVEQVRAVKFHLLTALAGVGTSATDGAEAWPARHREALTHWRTLHREHEAEWLAWGELQARWHKLHGERAAADVCCGCRLPLADTAALDLGDGTRVHIGDLNCVLRHGARWRRVATRALVELGLHPPAGAP